MPDTPALIDADRPDRYYMTRNDYRLWAKRLAVGLKKAGLQPGEPVLLYSGNTLFFPIVLIGTIMAEGIFTGANPNYNSREVAYQLSNSGARFLICGEGSLDVGAAAAKEAGLPNDRVFVFDDGYDTFDGVGKAKKGFKHWSALIASKDEAKDWEWRSDKSMLHDTIALNYSSGTTGLPKGVEITHRNYVANGLQHGHLVELRSDYEEKKDSYRWLCFLPMYHAMAQTLFCVTGPSRHIPVYILRKFDFERMLQCLQDFRISDLHAVPPIIVMMTKSPLVKKYDLSSISNATSGAAPLGSEVINEFAKLWPPGIMNLKQGWGMTE